MRWFWRPLKTIVNGATCILNCELLNFKIRMNWNKKFINCLWFQRDKIKQGLFPSPNEFEFWVFNDDLSNLLCNSIKDWISFIIILCNSRTPVPNLRDKGHKYYRLVVWKKDISKFNPFLFNLSLTFIIGFEF